MTQKEIIQLLIEELCPRLPYGVKGTVTVETWNGDFLDDGFMDIEKADVEVELVSVNISNNDIYIKTEDFDWAAYIEELQEGSCYFTIGDFRPILRPLESMTDDERKELRELCDKDLSEYAGHLRKGHGLSRDGHYKFMETRQLKWLLKNHFDFNNVMEKLNEADKTNTSNA